MAIVLCTAQAQAQTTFVKADNTTSLNFASSYTNNSGTPTSADTILIDNTLTASRTVTLGTNINVNLINMTAVPVGGTSRQLQINATAGSTLTIYGGGITKATNTSALIVNSDVALGANQTWTLSSVTGTGTGNFQLNTTNFTDNGFTLSINGTGTLDLRPGGNLTLGTNVTINTASISINAAAAAVTFGGNNTYTNLSIPVGRGLFSSIGNFGQASAAGTGGTAADITLGTAGGFGIFEYTGATASSTRSFNMDNRSTVGGGIVVSEATTTLTISGAIKSSQGTATAGNNVWTFGGAGNLVLSGIISDKAGVSAADVTLVTKTGAGTLTLSGTNSYEGATTISNGVLQIGAGGTTGSISNSASIVLAGGSIGFNRSDNLTQGTSFLTNGSAITGTGGLIKSGGGTLTLNQANLYNGATTINAGTLLLSGSGALSNSTTVSVAGGATFNVGSRSQEIAGLTGAGAVTNASGTLTVNKASGNDSFSGSINGAANLAKSGNGTLTLSGNSAYTGTTAVSAGALIVNGNNSAANGNVTVDSGAILGGSGTIGGTTTISGSLRPGNSIGTLTVNADTTWNAGDAWVFELGSAAPSLLSASSGGSTQDKLIIAGAGSDFLKGTGSGWTFNFAGTATEEGYYQLVTWAGGTSDFSATDFQATNLGGSYTGQFTIDSNALYLQVVPEPSTYALLAMSGLGLAGHMIRRRTRRHS